jgi:hypothetical protein
MGAAVLSFLVGFLGSGLLLCIIDDPGGDPPRWAVWTLAVWAAVWMLPPLVILWMTMVLG